MATVPGAPTLAPTPLSGIPRPTAPATPAATGTTRSIPGPFGLNSTITTPPPAPPPAPAPAYTNPTAPGVNVSSTNPSNSLLGQTITPGATANRVDIANADLQNWQQQQAPIFNANLRNATQQAAGAGQLGSGQLRTSLGDLAYNQNQATNAAMGNFTQNALTGSIGDAYNNVGIAQQQQQFQAGLQNQGFNQGLQSLIAGESGNPSSTQLGLSGVYGQQAAAGQQGVGNIIQGTTQNNNNQAYQQQILNMIGRGQPATQTPAPTNSGSSPVYGSLGNAGSYIGNGTTY